MADGVHLRKVQTPRALFRQPLALQWFQDGELVKRLDNERSAGNELHYSNMLPCAQCPTGRFELFLDLLYVAILANFAENVAEHASGSGLVKYIVSETAVTLQYLTPN